MYIDSFVFITFNSQDKAEKAKPKPVQFTISPETLTNVKEVSQATNKNRVLFCSSRGANFFKKGLVYFRSRMCQSSKSREN